MTQGALRLWYISLAVLLALGLWAWFGDWWQAYRLGLRRGGWLMIGLAVHDRGHRRGRHCHQSQMSFGNSSPLFIACSSKAIPGCSYFSDTLIRLFPIRFWQDAFLWAAVIALGGGLALALGIKPKI